MVNLKLLSLSLLALVFLVLAFVWNPWFMAGAVILVLINQRELLKYSKKKQ